MFLHVNKHALFLHDREPVSFAFSRVLQTLSNLFTIAPRSSASSCAYHPKINTQDWNTKPLSFDTSSSLISTVTSRHINRFWFVFSLTIFILNKYKTILQYNNTNNNKYSILHFDLYFCSHTSSNASKTEAYY